MKNISYIISPTGISAVIGGSSYTVAVDNPVYRQVKDAFLREASDIEIEDLFVRANAAKRYLNGTVEVNHGELFFNGEAIHGVVVDRIFEFMSEGLPYEPLIKFIERLQANPSFKSRQQLYTFLEHRNLAITPDGHFLAYKGVKENYTDVHTGRFSNHVGAVLSMERAKVDDDSNQGCSYGFHAGSLEYATSFGPRCVIVEIDPADVVSVPADCEFQKLRTCKYKVVAVYNGPVSGLRNAATPYEEPEWSEEYQAGYEAGIEAADYSD
ncbi:MAG: hypothetical protein ABI162_06815 [Luteolibacter sp.]